MTQRTRMNQFDVPFYDDLNAYFQENPFPSKRQKRILAETLKMPLETVVSFFKEQRKRQRRLLSNNQLADIHPKLKYKRKGEIISPKKDFYQYVQLSSHSEAKSQTILKQINQNLPPYFQEKQSMVNQSSLQSSVQSSCPTVCSLLGPNNLSNQSLHSNDSTQDLISSFYSLSLYWDINSKIQYLFNEMDRSLDTPESLLSKSGLTSDDLFGFVNNQYPIDLEEEFGELKKEDNERVNREMEEMEKADEWED